MSLIDAFALTVAFAVAVVTGVVAWRSDARRG